MENVIRGFEHASVLSCALLGRCLEEQKVASATIPHRRVLKLNLHNKYHIIVYLLILIHKALFVWRLSDE